MQDFKLFFRVATGHESPYNYQNRLAGGTTEPPNSTKGTPCTSCLISIPTGMGKTAAVTLAWLWNRIALQDPAWPRRLVYCLPMRTLVEQTRDEIALWLQNLAKTFPDNSDLQWLAHRSPIILMGGEDNDASRREWDIYPEKPAIIVGTQDMLLSRALNRGYGMARARWPMHFALLNNDCLWIMDETQLMGAGLWTSAQLDWLRQDRFKPVHPCFTWWMSATVGTAFLDTKDRENMPKPEKLPDVEDVIKANRPLSNWSPDKKTQKDRAAYITALAAAIKSKHTSGTLTLVVCNTVKDAQDVAAQTNGAILLTSRFRPIDRKAHLDKLLAFEKARKQAIKNKAECQHEGLICVATQVIEAGVDISARRLWSELAPWPSIVQRLGRCNRDGKLIDAQAHIFEIPTEKNAVSPYEEADLKLAKSILDKHNNTADIEKSLQPKPTPFPRAFDVHGLFSTEPDLFGGFTDVSQWVRGSDKNADVTVFWRDWDTAKKSPNAPEYVGSAFQRDEGCAVAVWHVRDFVKSAKSAFIWNDRTEKWESIKPDNICPGMVVLLPTSAGGYDAEKGWTGNKANKPANAPPPGPFDAAGEDDDTQTTLQGEWLALDAHLVSVVAEVEKIADALALSPAQRTALISAAQLHDIGKSLKQWQDALPTPRPDGTTLWAKAPSLAKRPGMRHEAASALAAWHQYYCLKNQEFPALAIYLIAAHHGLVRTVLSSRPSPAQQPNIAGIPITEPPPRLPFNNWQLDFTSIADGMDGTFSEDNTSFTPDTPGWSALVADLLGGWDADVQQATTGAIRTNNSNESHSLNPFILSYLETLLRAADARASQSVGPSLVSSASGVDGAQRSQPLSPSIEEVKQ